MATKEQCEKALRKRIRTRADVERFVEEWGGGWKNPAWKADKVFVENNTRLWVDDAFRYGKLDQLGMKLGFPSDAEMKRRTTTGAIRRSWMAIVVAIVALLVSIYVALQN